MHSIAIQIFEEKYRETAEQCAQRLGLQVFSLYKELSVEELSLFPLLLCCDEGRWCLRQNIHYYIQVFPGKTTKQIKKEMLGDLYLDFVSGSLKHRFSYGGGKGQDIAKAIGISKKKSLTILDATAGLGRDAFVLSSLGCHVEMCEENSIVHFLLEHGLASGLASLDQYSEDDKNHYSVLERMSLKHENSLKLIESKENKWDVIYLDPMFPERIKSAKVKKEMQYLHWLLDPNRNLEQKNSNDIVLLDAALKANCSRVVVKRPSHAPSLSSSQKPSYTVTGKSTRFDVYALKSLT